MMRNGGMNHAPSACFRARRGSKKVEHAKYGSFFPPLLLFRAIDHHPHAGHTQTRSQREEKEICCAKVKKNPNTT